MYAKILSVLKDFCTGLVAVVRAVPSVRAFQAFIPFHSIQCPQRVGHGARYAQLAHDLLLPNPQLRQPRRAEGLRMVRLLHPSPSL